MTLQNQQRPQPQPIVAMALELAGGEPGTPRLRSDAVANRERILVAATAAVRAHGDRVPLATVADRAGVGIGTLYRHFPTRDALLAALTLRSFELVLEHARAAATGTRPALEALEQFLDQTIAAREQLILPLHGGPVIDDYRITALRTEIRSLLTELLERGRRSGKIRAEISAMDVILTGAMLAQPLPQVADWDRLARRQARIFVAGIAAPRS